MRSNITKFEYLCEAIKHPPADKTKCIEWPYGLSFDGYGALRSPWKETRAHRIAYVLTYGPLLPDQWSVCHHCDNPKCFRPSHLFLGTNADNFYDAVRKDRFVGHRFSKGKINGTSKLTEAQIRKMNAMYLSGNYKKKDIAKQFEITYGHLWQLVTRRAWAHLTDLQWNKP